LQHGQNDLIVIDGTQDAVVGTAYLLETSVSRGLSTLAMPMYIPVVFGNCDVYNNLLL